MIDRERPTGQRQVHVRRMVWELARGAAAPPVPKYVLVPRCGHALCVADGCLEVMTKRKRIRQAVEAGAFDSLAFRAAISAGRSRDSVLQGEGLDRLRYGEEPVPALASELGVSLGYAYAVRSGVNRRDYTAPFAGLVPVLRSRRP
jgi:hypothetical protein